MGALLTRSQREAVILRSLPATFATLAHLLSSEDHATKGLESLRLRNLVEEFGGKWHRRDSIRSFRLNP
jgi:hypothetical protein